MTSWATQVSQIQWSTSSGGPAVMHSGGPAVMRSGAEVGRFSFIEQCNP